jgi:hypothetical protein
MSKSKHHFVPKFYLRLFTENPNRIHVYNLKQRRAIENAALRDQCYKHHLHGQTDEFEDQIGMVEGAVAPYLQQVAETSTLPDKGSSGHLALCFFVALQMTRTTRAVELLTTGADKMIQEVVETHGSEVEGLDELREGLDDPVKLSISMTWDMLQGISDLEPHLLRTVPAQPFITSDNPVFKYNQYLENIKGFGVTGIANRGLQIFVPLSGTHLLLLYDSTVYRIGTADQPGLTYSLTDKDRVTLNSMQVHSAEQNLYFGDWRKTRYVEGIVRGSIAQKLWDPVRVEELMGREDERRSLIHQYNEMPNLKLNLSFMSIRKKAQRISLQDRLNNKNRDKWDLSGVFPEPPPPPGARLVTTHFVRRTKRAG